jgi:hypothetical protein
LARTRLQLLNEWRASGRGGLWEDYWAGLWTALIRLYISLSFELIPIARLEKMPIRGAYFLTMRFSPDALIKHVLDEGNLALNAGPSNVLALDYDSKILPALLLRLMSFFPTFETPRGYCFLVRPPFDEGSWEQLKKLYPSFESARGEGMYQLLPLSETCAKKGHGTPKAECPPHDYRVRQWVGQGLALPIPTFQEFVRKAI